MGATLKRELGQGHERTSSGIAGAVPPSLARTTIIDAILQAADEIQDEDPNVARICKFLYIDSRYNFINIQLLLHFEVFLSVHCRIYQCEGSSILNFSAILFKF